MGFRLTDKAAHDIGLIAETGIRLFGINQAHAYHDALFDVFELLAANPRMARERHEISPPVRIHPFKAHLIVYVIEDDGGILIIRVRHGHEDLASPSS